MEKQGRLAVYLPPWAHVARHVQKRVTEVTGDYSLPLLPQLVQLHLEGGDLLVDPLEVPPLLPHLLPLQAELPQPGSPLGPALWSREGPHITGREAWLFLRTVSQLKS